MRPDRFKDWRRGTWVRAQLTPADITFIVGVLVAQAAWRGFDYATGNDNTPRPPGTAPTVAFIESAFPLWVWAVALFGMCGLLTYGAATRRHTVVWLGHGLGWALYLVLFVGLFIPALMIPWLDGVRGATALITPTMLHFLLWLRTGPRPLTLEEATPVGSVIGPTQ